MDRVGYEWVIVSGNRYHASPEKLASRSGIKNHIQRILKEEYRINSMEVQGNRGRLQLNPEDLKRYLESEKDVVTIQQPSVETKKSKIEKENIETRFDKMTCVELKDLLRQCSLKVSGRKAELIERLQNYHQMEHIAVL